MCAVVLTKRKKSYTDWNATQYLHKNDINHHTKALYRVEGSHHWPIKVSQVVLNDDGWLVQCELVFYLLHISKFNYRHKTHFKIKQSMCLWLHFEEIVVLSLLPSMCVHTHTGDPIFILQKRVNKAKRTKKPTFFQTFVFKLKTLKFKTAKIMYNHNINN